MIDYERRADMAIKDAVDAHMIRSALLRSSRVISLADYADLADPIQVDFAPEGNEQRLIGSIAGRILDPELGLIKVEDVSIQPLSSLEGTAINLDLFEPIEQDVRRFTLGRVAGNANFAFRKMPTHHLDRELHEPYYTDLRYGSITVGDKQLFDFITTSESAA